VDTGAFRAAPGAAAAAISRGAHEIESDCKQACGRCDQINELLCLVAELQEEVGRMRCI